MKLTENILILKRSEILKSKKGNSYFTINFASVDGEVYQNVLVNNIERYEQFVPFNQVKVEVQIKSTVYGIKINIM